MTLPPLAGMASGLSQATSSDMGLHLSTGTLAAAVTGTLVAAVLAGLAVTSKTLRRQAA
ncbi:hypothetical protein ABZY20_24105 [Streptomyces sp. NPDC006624]|uniref:hypothetical protein n=1 Tax=unclassified Streptomyces TaxID=2593676 RepID=UPI0033A970EE